MISDLNFPLSVKVCPIKREADGLAMSSRNVYLSPTERQEAGALNRALVHAKRLVAQGELDAVKIISEIKKLILEETSASIEYVSLVSMTDLKPVRRINGDLLIALAVRFSSVRLIDNTIVKFR